MGVSSRVHDILITEVVEEKSMGDQLIFRVHFIVRHLTSFPRSLDLYDHMLTKRKKEFCTCILTSSLKLVLRRSSKESKKYVWSLYGRVVSMM